MDFVSFIRPCVMLSRIAATTRIKPSALAFVLITMSSSLINAYFGVSKVWLNKLLECLFMLFDLAEVIFGELLLLSLHHGFILLLKETIHAWNTFENQSTLLGVLRDRDLWSQSSELIGIQMLLRNGLFAYHVFDHWTES